MALSHALPSDFGVFEVLLCYAMLMLWRNDPGRTVRTKGGKGSQK